jgi:arabinose-5-phosphate isomerase
MGMTAITSSDGRVEGIFTDGDLRRLLDKPGDFRTLKIRDVMTSKPRTISADQLAIAAVELMERHKIGQILVADDEGILIGALNTYDLLDAKVI